MYFIIQRALKATLCLLEQVGKGEFRLWKKHDCWANSFLISQMVKGK